MGKNRINAIKTIIFLLFVILFIFICNLEFNKEPYIKDYIFSAISCENFDVSFEIWLLFVGWWLKKAELK